MRIQYSCTMPLSRRVKGRCRTAAAVKEKKTKEKERVNEVRAPENVEMRATVEPVDDAQLEEAKSTIQRLARKYLHKAQRSGEETSGLDIVRVEEGEGDVETCNQQTSEQREAEMEAERSDAFDFRGSQESKSKENRAKREKKPKSSAKLTPKRTEKVLVPRGGARLQGTPVKRAQKSKPSLSSPDIKIPKPTLGHSTPSSVDRNAIRRHSLFGFEALDSPLTLSPVTSTPYLQETPFKSPEGKITKSSSYSKLIGTYDIPIRKPSPRKQQARRKIAQSSSEVEAWAKKLNAEFAEVDKFELVVE